MPLLKTYMAKALESIPLLKMALTSLANQLKLPSVEHIPYENIKSDSFFYKQKCPMLLIASGISLVIYLLFWSIAFPDSPTKTFSQLNESCADSF
jgi:hypothetical protein